MKQIIFTFENIKKIEVFVGVTLYSYYQIGTPSATFKFPLPEGELSYKQKELNLEEGEVIFKDKNNNIFKKVN